MSEIEDDPKNKALVRSQSEAASLIEDKNVTAWLKKILGDRFADVSKTDVRLSPDAQKLLTGDLPRHKKDIIPFTWKIMKIAEAQSKLNGARKKQVVLEILRYAVITEIDLEVKEKTLLLLMVEELFPEIIDSAVGLARGTLDIGKKIETVKEAIDQAKGSCCNEPSNRCSIM